ncbi:hypothetical protein V5N11_029976 [Cardamine amara subsp. amara]|uniref:CCHC-type domain-containing protein n=1 Tax=Cardamine amara subsp. amara TaxID=228776 RepID=A0ABD0ZBK7_CARAN
MAKKNRSPPKLPPPPPKVPPKSLPPSVSSPPPLSSQATALIQPPPPASSEADRPLPLSIPPDIVASATKNRTSSSSTSPRSKDSTQLSADPKLASSGSDGSGLKASITASQQETPSQVTPAVEKPTWCDHVKGSSRPMAKKGVSFTLDSGELCVEIPNEVITKNKHRWDNFIIGQFHGKAPSPGALHAITNGIWSSRLRNISVSKLTERSFLIKIPCAVTRQRVLNQGMWHIENQSMFVAKWEPGLEPVVPELTSAPVWLDFHNVPLHFYSEEGLEHIAGLVGKPKFLHPNTANMSNLEVARVFTIIDPTKPLPEAVNVKFQSGQIQRVLVSSPWLPPTCVHCKAIGHSIKRCPSAPITCSDCNSTGHPTASCPRAKKTSATTDPIAKKQRKKRSAKSKKPLETTPIVIDGTLVVDIGLDKIKATEIISTSAATPGKTPSDSDDDSSDSSESQSGSESESSEETSYSSEEKEQPPDTSFSPVISKRKKKMQAQLVKKASAYKSASYRGKGPKSQ